MKKPGRSYRSSEQQWKQIQDCFHRRKGRKGFAPKVSNRKAFEAVLYRERTGCPWRDVPAFHGCWHTISMRRQRWVEAGVPRKAMIVRYLEAVIPLRSNQRRPADYDKEKYQQRNQVERLFNRSKHFRAVATRYDKPARMFLGGILAALSSIPLT